MGYIGGQALVEGVMMKGDIYISRAVYAPSKNLVVDKIEFKSWSAKYPILKLPFLRGSVSLIEMMIIGMKSLLYSIQVSSPEEEQLSKNELHSSLLISFAFSIGLFIIIPATFFNFLRIHMVHAPVLLLATCEGLFRMAIFLGFMISTLFMADMRRLYEFHGAEHKAVNAHEAGLPLTIENVRKQTRIHTRCGTSFIMLVLLISILIFSLIGKQDLIHRIFWKILLFPVISGIAYELIRVAAKFSKIWLFNIILYPGLLVQKLTTREPDDEQIQAAISAIKEVI